MAQIDLFTPVRFYFFCAAKNTMHSLKLWGQYCVDILGTLAVVILCKLHFMVSQFRVNLLVLFMILDFIFLFFFIDSHV